MDSTRSTFGSGTASASDWVSTESSVSEPDVAERINLKVGDVLPLHGAKAAHKPRLGEVTFCKAPRAELITW